MTTDVYIYTPIDSKFDRHFFRERGGGGLTLRLKFYEGPSEVEC